MGKKYILLIFIFSMTIFLSSCLSEDLRDSPKSITSIPILMYHHLSPDEETWNSSTISPEKFKKDMMFLKEKGYTTILPKDLVAYKEEGKRLPNKPIMVTFDDGYRSNYEYAYPILKELEMKAVISIIGWSVGKSTLMDGITPITPHFNWEEAREMYQSGVIDIQHHTYDLHNPEGAAYGSGEKCSIGVERMHGEGDTAYRKRLIKDTQKLKECIEKEIGNQVIFFAYPYGVYNETSEEIIKELGYKISVTTNEGIANIEDNLFLLSRINVGMETNLEDILGNEE